MSARNYPRRDVGGRDVDSESWSIFQKFLLRDNESSSRNNIENYHIDRNMQTVGFTPKGCNGRRHDYV